MAHAGRALRAVTACLATACGPSPTGVDVWGGQPGQVVATGGLQGSGRPGMTGGRMGLREEMPASRRRAVGRIGR